MQTLIYGAGLRPVTETRGGQLRARRLKHGMTVSQLHREAKVSRDAIDAAEDDKASDVTYGKLEAWFDAFEEEVGYEEPSGKPEPHMVTIRGSRGGDIDVVVSGPVEDLEALTATVERLLRRPDAEQSEDD